MNKILRIGTGKSNVELYLSERISTLLSDAGIQSTLIFMDTPNERSGALSLFSDSICNNIIDIAGIDMSWVPPFNTKENHEVIIGALLARQLEGEGILISENFIEKNSILNIHSDAIIGTSNRRQESQLRLLNPALKTIILADESKSSYDHLGSTEVNGLVITKIEYKCNSEKFSDYSFIALHPKEMLPAPGNGITGILAAKADIETRQLLKKIHQSEWVIVNNTERKLVQLASAHERTNIGIYAQKDLKGYFHVTAVRGDTGKKVQLSQSISADMPEKIYQLLYNSN